MVIQLRAIGIHTLLININSSNHGTVYSSKVERIMGDNPEDDEVLAKRALKWALHVREKIEKLEAICNQTLDEHQEG